MAMLEGQWMSDTEYERWYMGCPDPEYEAWCNEQDYLSMVERGEVEFGPWTWELVPLSYLVYGPPNVIELENLPF